LIEFIQRTVVPAEAVMATITYSENIVEKRVHQISDAIRVVSMVALFLMMIFVPLDVFGRYVLRSPIYGDLQYQQLAMVLIVFLALPYCTYKKGHIYVELLVNRLSGRTLAVVQSMASLAGLAIMVFIAYNTGVYGVRELMAPLKQTTALVSIPLFPFILVATLGCAVMSLELLFEFIHSISRFSKNVTKDPTTAPGPELRPNDVI
jgi:TRAP-type C4-dicarboxylate transport system permease small subunit